MALDGVWTYNNLVGSTIRLKSTSATFGGLFGTPTQELTVEDVFFRVSTDGKAVVVFRTVELPESLINIADIEVINLNPFLNLPAICGEFLASQALCGYQVTSDPSYQQADGLVLLDENGVVIKDRYIRILDAVVENPETDTDQVTDIDININGNILD